MVADNPNFGRERPELGADIRSAPVSRYRQYVIFYRVRRYGIEVARIVHGARNLPDLF